MRLQNYLAYLEVWLQPIAAEFDPLKYWGPASFIFDGFTELASFQE
jgi:hypothetical protein